MNSIPKRAHCSRLGLTAMVPRPLAVMPLLELFQIGFELCGNFAQRSVLRDEAYVPLIPEHEIHVGPHAKKVRAAACARRCGKAKPRSSVPQPAASGTGSMHY
jgi:hypothetical protein